MRDTTFFVLSFCGICGDSYREIGMRGAALEKLSLCSICDDNFGQDRDKERAPRDFINAAQLCMALTVALHHCVPKALVRLHMPPPELLILTAHCSLLTAHCSLLTANCHPPRKKTAFAAFSLLAESNGLIDLPVLRIPCATSQSNLSNSRRCRSR